MSIKFVGNIQIRSDMYYKEAETQRGVPYIMVKATSSKNLNTDGAYSISFYGVMEFWGEQCKKFKEMEIKNYEYLTILSGLLESKYDSIGRRTVYHFVVFEFERKKKSATPQPPPIVVEDAPPEPILPDGFPF